MMPARIGTWNDSHRVRKSERLLGLEELDDSAFDVYQDSHGQIDLGMRFFVNDVWESTSTPTT